MQCELTRGFGSMLQALSLAFATSIHGHDMIKRALVLQLVWNGALLFIIYLAALIPDRLVALRKPL